jgi:hypothetical protein
MFIFKKLLSYFLTPVRILAMRSSQKSSFEAPFRNEFHWGCPSKGKALVDLMDFLPYASHGTGLAQASIGER